MSPLSQSMDLWTILALATGVVGVLLVILGLKGDRSRGRRRCPRCWYSMAGVPGLVCPECGRDARLEKRLFKRRRRWRMVILGTVLMLGAAGGYAWRTATRDGTWALVPFSGAVHVMPWYTEAPAGLIERVQARLQAGPIREWQREHLYGRMGLILENPRATRAHKIVALRTIETVSWRGGYNGRATGEAGGAAPTLIGALDDADADVRAFAAGLLGSTGGDPAAILAALVPLMDTDADLEVRMAAVGSVGQLGGKPEAGRIEIVPRLRRSYTMGDGAAKLWCIDAAGKLGGVQPDAVAWLIELLEGSDVKITGSVCEALRKAGPSAVAAAPALARVMGRGDQSIALAAARAIVAIGDPAGAARADFFGAVKKHAGFAPVFAAYETVYRGQARTIDDLLEASAGWTPGEAAFAAAYACDMGAAPASFLPLLERAVRTVSPSEKEAAWTSVYKWAFVGGSRDRELLEHLPPVDVPKHPGEVWRAALRGRILGDDEGAVRTIAGVLALDAKWTASWTRGAAADALGYFGETARPTLPALQELLKEEAWEPRERAREAIERITGVKPPEPK